MDLASPYGRRRRSLCLMIAPAPRTWVARSCVACSRTHERRAILMSRIGKKPVAIPKGVTASVHGQEVAVKGPKGELKHVLVDDVIAKLEDGRVEVAMRENTLNGRAMWGMSRTLISNLMTGVTEGFNKKLEITGVGYRAAVQGSNVQLQLGYG